MQYKKRLNKRERHQQKVIADKKNKWILITIFAGLIVLFFGSHLFQYINKQKDKNAYKEYIGMEVPAKSVCMRGDLVKHDPTFEVIIEGKTYQACCNKCESNLLTSKKSRITQDPFTKEFIDKAGALIFLDPNNKGKVLYFESEANYLKFLISK